MREEATVKYIIIVKNIDSPTWIDSDNYDASILRWNMMRDFDDWIPEFQKLHIILKGQLKVKLE